MAKKMIDTVVEPYVKHQLCGKLSEAAAYLAFLIEKHGPDAVLDIGEEMELHNDQYHAYARVYVHRMETDEEEAWREASAAAAKARVEEHERKQWEKLNAKYGKKEE